MSALRYSTPARWSGPWLNRLTAEQPRERLVHPGGALQGVIRTLGLQIMMSQPPQLFTGG
jgi:hypothetical protein